MSTIGHELTYTSHPSFICNVCYNQGSGPVHECSACQFHVHPYCASSNTPPPSVLHWAHPYHRLSLQNNIGPAEVQISCNACGQRVVGFVYSCRSCNFDLHPVCASLPREPLHSQHTQHRLELLPRPAYSSHAFQCNACSEIGKTWVYHCRICQFDLHLSCANLRHDRRERAPQSEARMQLQWGAGSANEPPHMGSDGQQWRPPLGSGNSQWQAPINVAPHQQLQHPMPRPISYGSQLGTRVLETAVVTAIQAITQAAVNYAFQHPGGTYGNNSYGNNSTGSYGGGNVDNSGGGSYVDNSGGGSYVDYSLYGDNYDNSGGDNYDNSWDN